jgi:hypothetical protein
MAGVETGDLEEVLDQSLKPNNVARQQVERRLGPLGEVVATSFHHFDRGGKCHQWRSQLVTDVGGEPGIALHPELEGFGHVVE